MGLFELGDPAEGGIVSASVGILGLRVPAGVGIIGLKGLGRVGIVAEVGVSDEIVMTVALLDILMLKFLKFPCLRTFQN